MRTQTQILGEAPASQLSNTTNFGYISAISATLKYYQEVVRSKIRHANIRYVLFWVLLWAGLVVTRVLVSSRRGSSVASLPHHLTHTVNPVEMVSS